MGKLTEIGKKYDTDKSTYHGFTDFYEKHLYELKHNYNDILEIGIYNGSSLKMLKEYFEKSNIYGIDIFEKSSYDEERIKTFICDQTDIEKINNIFYNTYFNIIIDDGGHTMSQQQISFKNLIYKLNKNGFYIIEDLHTSLNFNHYEVDKNEETTLTLLKSIKDNKKFSSKFVSEDEFTKISKIIEYVDILEINKDNEFGKSITSVIKIK
jgi:23S rRNA U2552 (ribose-2'-O)-methylase RlmE/FtsJ